MEAIRRLCVVIAEASAALLLALPAAAADLRGALGMVIELGSFAPHEYESARRLSLTLVDERYVVALASTLDGVPTPAFDGLVVDEQGRPVANISIKRIARSDAEKLFFVGRRAFRTMRHFRERRAWVRVLGKHGDRQLMKTVTALFGIGESRAEWLVLDTSAAAALDESVLNYLAGSLTEGRPDRRIFILEEKKMYEMHAGRWWPRAPCAGLL